MTVYSRFRRNSEVLAAQEERERWANTAVPRLPLGIAANAGEFGNAGAEDFCW